MEPSVIRVLRLPPGRHLWLPDWKLAEGHLLVVAAFCPACGEYTQPAALQPPWDSVGLCTEAMRAHWAESPLCHGTMPWVPIPWAN